MTTEEINTTSNLYLCQTIKENIHENYCSTAKISQGYCIFEIIVFMWN